MVVLLSRRVLGDEGKPIMELAVEDDKVMLSRENYSYDPASF